jgi:hypothetical protein
MHIPYVRKIFKGYVTPFFIQVRHEPRSNPTFSPQSGKRYPSSQYWLEPSTRRKRKHTAASLRHTSLVLTLSSSSQVTFVTGVLAFLTHCTIRSALPDTHLLSGFPVQPLCRANYLRSRSMSLSLRSTTRRWNCSHSRRLPRPRHMSCSPSTSPGRKTPFADGTLLVCYSVHCPCCKTSIPSRLISNG